MKKTILFSFALMAAAVATAQTFSKVFNGTLPDRGEQVITTSDGGLLTVGFIGSVNNGDIYVVKTNSAGTVIWKKAYGTSANIEAAYSVTQLTGGAYIISGYTMPFPSGISDGLLMKISATGTLMWMKKYTTSTFNDGIYCVNKTSDGGYVTVSSALSPTTLADIVVTRYTAADVESWQKQYECGTSNGEYASWIEQTSDGGYILAGNKYYSGWLYFNDHFLMKINSTGVVTWAKTFGTIAEENLEHVQQTADGGYIMTGFGDGPLVVKTTSTGTISWSNRYGSAGSAEQNYMIRETSAGDFVYCGTNPQLSKINSSGTEIWSKNYGCDEMKGLVITPANEIAICGSATSSAGDVEFYFGRTDASGVNCADQTASSPATPLSFTHNVSPTITVITGALTLSAVTGITTSSVGTETSKCKCIANAGPDKIAEYCTTSFGTVIGTTAVPGQTYLWTPSTALSSTTADKPTASPMPADCVPYLYIDYTVQASGAGCMTATDVVRVTPVMQSGCGGPKRLSGPEIGENNIVSPNPSSGFVNINTGDVFSGTIRMMVLDITGKIVFEKNIEAGYRDQIDLNSVPKGLYFVTMSDGSTTLTGKLILQ